MNKWFAVLSTSAALAFTGCGGGGDSIGSGGGTVEVPVISKLSFPVRAAYETMVDPAEPIALNLAGSDDAEVEPTYTEVNWPSWSKFPPPAPELIPANLGWIGTITAQRRSLSTPVDTPLGDSVIAVDYTISLKRLRDGREYRDALTIYFDSAYSPRAAVTMQSRVWNWLSPVDGLPMSGRIGVSSGLAVAQTCKLTVGMIDSMTCDPSFFEDGDRVSVPAVWSLQPDTADTGFVTFSYRAPFLDAIEGTDSFTRSEATVEIKARIDSTGAFKGIEYVRTEGPVTILLRG